MVKKILKKLKGFTDFHLLFQHLDKHKKIIKPSQDDSTKKEVSK